MEIEHYEQLPSHLDMVYHFRLCSFYMSSDLSNS